MKVLLRQQIPPEAQASRQRIQMIRDPVPFPPGQMAEVTQRRARPVSPPPPPPPPVVIPHTGPKRCPQKDRRRHRFRNYGSSRIRDYLQYLIWIWGVLRRGDTNDNGPKNRFLRQSEPDIYHTSKLLQQQLVSQWDVRRARAGCSTHFLRLYDEHKVVRHPVFSHVPRRRNGS